MAPPPVQVTPSPLIAFGTAQDWTCDGGYKKRSATDHVTHVPRFMTSINFGLFIASNATFPIGYLRARNLCRSAAQVAFEPRELSNRID
jgi:hypothetical protein